jgi:DNA segregation ATPase FtsK/SpoIIIE, S-DNA-T family
MNDGHGKKDDHKTDSAPKKKRSFLGNIAPILDDDAKLTLGIVGCFALGTVLLFSLFGWSGTLGASLRNFMFNLLGWVFIFIPFALFLSGLVMINLQRNSQLREDLSNKLFWGMALITVSISALFSLFMGPKNWSESSEAGGVVGYAIYPYVLERTLGPLASTVILIMIFAFGFFLVSNFTFVQFMHKSKEVMKDPSKFMDFIPDVLDIWKKDPKTQKTKGDIVMGQLNADSDIKHFIPGINKPPVDEEMANETKPSLKAKLFGLKTKQKETEKKPKTTFNFTANKTGVLEFKKSDGTKLTWGLPPFDLLKETDQSAVPGDIAANKDIISKTFSHFGIKVEMDEAIVGPTVTQYTFKPANGVKLSTIDNLQRDLALSLAAPNIRIQPIPGKTLVGIEVPNKTKATVRLRNLLQTKEFVESDNLTVALGVDVAGNNILYPIGKMPHLLVAGATGSGKSVWINNMLLSLLFKYSPHSLQLILVDMKRVELKLYDGIPHLLTNVITDAEKAINALKWTVLEMERRYQLLEQYGKRNIKDFNEFTKIDKELKALPYVLFVIDELADLMIMAKGEVEPMIARLTQMSRAVGIHLILGTQRPDTSVITGLIKANVPTRIAFAVASQIDSRVILDSQGAEKLLGKGDGLVITPDNIAPVRFQGAFVDDAEVKETVDFLRNQMGDEIIGSNHLDEVTQPPKQKIKIPGFDETNGSDLDENNDEVYQQAKETVIRHQKASASFLQQMLGIGYPKAAKIVMKLEEKGVVGPQNGSKPRDVYMTPSDLFQKNDIDKGF